MSPELETLDQLQGGDLTLEVILKLFPSNEAFERGVLGLLSGGDVLLIAVAGDEVPQWRWRELFMDGMVFEQLGALKLRITPIGAKRVG